MKKLILLIVAAIAAASYLVYAYMNGDPMFGTLAKTMDDLPRNERLGSKRNIVVLGVDGREKDDDPGRSDTLFVVMFDPKSKNVSLLSIPRDTRVRIPGHGWDKINHAYAFGGHKLTQQTTEELLGIQVNNYVMVDFSGFESLVDAIGGIDIDVEKDMYYYDDWDDFLIDLPAGQQHLDGKKAIQYVRYRDEEGDIGRIKRQQKFMMAVYEKIASAQILTKMPGLVSEIMKMVKTDLPVSDMLAMGGALHGMMKEQGGLQMATVPGTPEYIDEISYWIPDITDLREQMVDMQGAQMTERYRQGAEKMEAEYKRNLITAQEKEKQKAAEEKIKADEQTEKKIKEDTKEKNKEKIKEKSFITVLIIAIRTVFNEELAKKFYFDEAEVEDLRTKLEDYKKATEDIYNYDFKTDIIDIIAEGLASQNLSLEVIEDILNSDVVDTLEKLGLSDQMPVLRQKINQIIKSQNDSKKTWELSDEEKERANDYDSRDEDIITVTLEEDYEK